MNSAGPFIRAMRRRPRLMRYFTAFSLALSSSTVTYGTPAVVADSQQVTTGTTCLIVSTVSGTMALVRITPAALEVRIRSMNDCRSVPSGFSLTTRL